MRKTTTTKSERIWRVIQSAPEKVWTTEDLQFFVSQHPDDVDTTRGQIAALISGMLKTPDRYPGLVRVSSGLYSYSPNGAPPPPEDVFAPIVAAIPPEAFAAVGMRVVATTKEGHRLVVDDKGTAWEVAVTVTARLV